MQLHQRPELSLDYKHKMANWNHSGKNALAAPPLVMYFLSRFPTRSWNCSSPSLVSIPSCTISILLFLCKLKVKLQVSFFFQENSLCGRSSQAAQSRCGFFLMGPWNFWTFWPYNLMTSWPLWPYDRYDLMTMITLWPFSYDLMIFMTSWPWWHYDPYDLYDLVTFMIL